MDELSNSNSTHTDHSLKNFRKLHPTQLWLCAGRVTSYFGWNSQDIASSSLPETSLKSHQQLVSYSMEYSTKVFHDFDQQKLCVIPVTLYLHNCSQQQVNVHYSANFNTGKPPRASQLYMPEAASPLLWIGCVQGDVCLKDTPAYSLVQGLQIDARMLGENVRVPSPKIEYTLIVDHKEV